MFGIGPPRRWPGTSRSNANRWRRSARTFAPLKIGRSAVRPGSGAHSRWIGVGAISSHCAVVKVRGVEAGQAAAGKWPRGPARRVPASRLSGGERADSAGKILPPAARAARPGPGHSGMPAAALGLPAAHRRQPDHARPVGRSTWTRRARPGRAEPARREALTHKSPQPILGAHGEPILQQAVAGLSTDQRGPTF